MPNWIYGDSYGQVMGAQQAQDAQRDQRFFQSLQANRAAQAQADAEAAQADQQAYQMAHLGLQAKAQEQSYLQNLLAHKEVIDWHNRNAAVAEGGAKLERDKFDFLKTQPTSAEINAFEKEAGRAEEAERSFKFSGTFADRLNQYDKVNAAMAKLDADLGTINTVGKPPSVFGKDAFAAKLQPLKAYAEEPNFDSLSLADKITAIRNGITNKKAQLAGSAASLATLIEGDRKSGGNQLVSRNDAGIYQSALAKPVPFDFSALARRSRLGQQTYGSALPASVAQPVAVPAAPAPTPGVPSQTASGNGGSPFAAPLPVSAPAAVPQAAAVDNSAAPTVPTTPEQARAMVRQLMSDGVPFVSAAYQVRQMMGKPQTSPDASAQDLNAADAEAEQGQAEQGNLETAESPATPSISVGQSRPPLVPLDERFDNPRSHRSFLGDIGHALRPTQDVLMTRLENARAQFGHGRVRLVQTGGEDVQTLQGVTRTPKQYFIQILPPTVPQWNSSDRMSAELENGRRAPQVTPVQNFPLDQRWTQGEAAQYGFPVQQPASRYIPGWLPPAPANAQGPRQIRSGYQFTPNQF